MILYLYALASGLQVSEVIGLTGVRDESLVCVDVEGIVAVSGWMDRAPEIARDTLFAQDRVVRDLHARAAALLPMRFGSSIGSEHQAREFVERRRTMLQEQLDLVRGREQMTLRILSAAGAPGAPGAAGLFPEARADETRAKAQGVGTRYLARRATEQIPPAVRNFVGRLESIQRAMRVEPHQHRDLIATIYHLIDRGTEQIYRRAIEDAMSGERLNVRVSGPSPAYAFASVP